METITRLSLYHLFLREQLFEDTNGDGYPDNLRLRLEIDPDLNDRDIWCGLLNLSARVVHHVTSIDSPDSPLIRIAGEKTPSRNPTLSVARPRKTVPAPASIRRLSPRHLFMEGCSGEAMGRLLTSISLSGERAAAPLPSGWERMLVSSDRKSVDIQNDRHRTLAVFRLYEPPKPPVATGRSEAASGEDLIDLSRAIYEMNDPKDPRSRRLRWKFELCSDGLSPKAGVSLVDFMAVCVLESTDITLPIAFPRTPGGVSGALKVIENELGTGGSEEALIRRTEDRILVSGSETGLSKAFRFWPMMMGASLNADPEKDDDFSRTLKAIRNLIGGRTEWGLWGRRLVRAAESVPLPPAPRRIRVKVERACRELKIPLPPVEVGEPPLRRRASWEDEISRIDRCIQAVPAGSGPLEGSIFISRSLPNRLECKQRWESMLRRSGYIPRLQVMNAYKPGFSWLTEVVLPALLAMEDPVDEACLSFRPYVSDDANGLEMESRWLQEAFPGPDCIARKLHWPPERIRFRQDSQLAEAYRFQAWSQDGKSLFDGGLTPFESGFDYIGNHRSRGRVHPTASGIRLMRHGEILVEKKIATDRERFWHILQHRWLPEMEAGMTARLSEVARSDRPVFWEEVRIEAAIDETDARLDIGRERICPMEALHEDIYFGLLDFFNAFCARHGISGRAHFGRILPVVSATAKRGKPSASLTARPRPVSDSEATVPVPQVASIVFSEDRCILSLTDTAETLTADEKHMLCRIARAWDMKMTFDGACFRADLPFPEIIRRNPLSDSDPLPPPMDRSLGLVETADWAARFEGFPHLEATRGGTSFQGRPIPVVEAFLHGRGARTSIAKTRAFKPTLLMIARHHANEISSTNAALSLCWRLSRTRSGRETLRRVNLACVPMENPDGVATYEALLPGCEDHILHAARYNALGVEWYADYLSDAPRFPEAAVKTRLWRRWLPIYVLDAHGVPNHEWVQPFGGYLNHRFREYWIPRAFLFVIMPFLDDPEHPEHERAKILAASFGAHLATEGDIQQHNRALRDRYERYARRFAPETFPGSVSEHLEIVPPGPGARETHFGHRAWPITRNEIVSEVVDEGADGAWLELCVRAHLRIADALLTALADHPRSRLESVRLPDGALSLGWRTSAMAPEESDPSR